MSSNREEVRTIFGELSDDVHVALGLYPVDETYDIVVAEALEDAALVVSSQ